MRQEIGQQFSTDFFSVFYFAILTVQYFDKISLHQKRVLIMQGTTCENLLSKPKSLAYCGCLFDEKTRARLERENQETWKGKFYNLLLRIYI